MRGEERKQVMKRGRRGVRGGREEAEGKAKGRVMTGRLRGDAGVGMRKRTGEREQVKQVLDSDEHLPTPALFPLAW